MVTVNHRRCSKNKKLVIFQKNTYLEFDIPLLLGGQFTFVQLKSIHRISPS
jgi:hypothetical protein